MLQIQYNFVSEQHTGRKEVGLQVWVACNCGTVVCFSVTSERQDGTSICFQDSNRNGALVFCSGRAYAAE